ncbi:MAG: ECF-type sigma factor [Gemmatimonadaceae bacterium]
MADASHATHLLRRWSEGSQTACDELIPLVYDELRRLARRRLRGAVDERSLDTTALVHEAYLRLADAPQLHLPDRARFLGLASRVMRNLLVDRARARAAEKRGGGQMPITLDEAICIADDQLDWVAELDAALDRLATLDRRQSEILEQRYFGGLSLEETAGALGISLATVKRELRSARAWLVLELRGEPIP